MKAARLAARRVDQATRQKAFLDKGANQEQEMFSHAWRDTFSSIQETTRRPSPNIQCLIGQTYEKRGEKDR